MEPFAIGHQDDPARRRRLRWRARRGLLENDLVLERFFGRHEARLTDADVAALDALLELSDNDLLDLVLARKEPAPAIDSPDVRRVLQWLRTA